MEIAVARFPVPHSPDRDHVLVSRTYLSHCEFTAEQVHPALTAWRPDHNTCVRKLTHAYLGPSPIQIMTRKIQSLLPFWMRVFREVFFDNGSLKRLGVGDTCDEG